MGGEQDTFEARAVLAPRRPRVARLALLVPVIALVVVASAGLSGPPRQSTADSPAAMAAATSSPRPQVRPTEVVGLDVHRLADVQPRALGRDEAVAVTGWYVATGVTDCPALAAIYRDGSLPWFRGDADTLAFCVRLGALYPTRPDPDDDRSENTRLPAVAVTVMVGVIMPTQLETVGTDPTEVVIIGRFVQGGHELLLDHVAWTPAV